MTVIERYHISALHTHHILKHEDKDIDDESALQMTVKAVNDSFYPEGLVPTLLLYGTLPSTGLADDKPAVLIYRSAAAINQTSREVFKLFAE